MMLILLLILALVGMPLFAVIAIAAMGGYRAVDLDLALVAMEFQRIADMPALVAAVLFYFAGTLVINSHIPERLVEFIRTASRGAGGRFTSLAILLVALFTAFAGVAGFTIILLAALMMSVIARSDGQRQVALGVVSSSSVPGALLAPSMALILYAAVTQQVRPGQGVAVHEMFLAGVVPALLILAMLIVHFAWRHRTAAPSLASGDQSLWSGLKANAWELPLPFVILGGIYSGWMPITDAAAITAAWLLISLLVIRREIAWTRLPGIIRQAMMHVGALLLLLGVSLALSAVLVATGTLQELYDAILPRVGHPVVLLVLLNLLLLGVGMLVNLYAAIAIMAPLVIPLAQSFGVDPVHLGIVLIAGVQIGFYIGMPESSRRRVASPGRDGDSATAIHGVPAIGSISAALALALLIITLWPALSLWLPGRL